MEKSEFLNIVSPTLEVSRRIRLRLYRNSWEGWLALVRLNPSAVRLVNFSSWESLEEKLKQVWNKNQNLAIVLEFVDPTIFNAVVLAEFVASHVEYVEREETSLTQYLQMTEELKQKRTELAASLRRRIPPHLWEIVSDIPFEYLLEHGRAANFPIDEAGLREQGFQGFDDFTEAVKGLEEAWEGQIEVHTEIDRERGHISIFARLKNFAS